MKVIAGHHYLAFVLDNETKVRLIHAVGASHPVLKCDHITIAYPVKQENVEDLQAIVDAKPVFHVNGYIEADNIDVLRVTMGDNPRRLDGKHYHITYARTEYSESNDANKVFEGELDIFRVHSLNIIVGGEFKLVPIE